MVTGLAFVCIFGVQCLAQGHFDMQSSRESNHQCSDWRATAKTCCALLQNTSSICTMKTLYMEYCLCVINHIEIDTTRNSSFRIHTNCDSQMTFIFSKQVLFLCVTFNIVINTIKMYLFWIDFKWHMQYESLLMFFLVLFDWHGCAVNSDGLSTLFTNVSLYFLCGTSIWSLTGLSNGKKYKWHVGASPSHYLFRGWHEEVDTDSICPYFFWKWSGYILYNR